MPKTNQEILDMAQGSDNVTWRLLVMVIWCLQKQHHYLDHVMSGDAGNLSSEIEHDHEGRYIPNGE